LAAKGRHEEFAREVSRTSRNILFLIIPATVCLLLLRAQIVRVVLGVGQFDWADTVATADTVAFFAISLFSQALWPLLARACFAIGDAYSPVWAVVGGIVVERIVAWQLLRYGMGTPALALAFSIGSIVVIVWLWAALRQRAGSLHEKDVIRSVAVTTVAAICMAFVVQAVKTTIGMSFGTQTFLTVLTQGMAAGAAGIGVFTAIAYMLGSEEARAVVAMYTRKFAPVPVADIKQEDGALKA
jgi:putative peptidoglycan lipid II flippase